MSSWLDIEDEGGSRRESLRAGLTRIGGADTEIPLRTKTSIGADQLHVWDDPPRAIFVGVGRPPTLAGRPVEEVQLRPGDRLQWAGATLLYGGATAEEDQAALEEISLEPPIPKGSKESAGPTAVHSTADSNAWKRIKAGLLLELGLADRKAAKRWQQKVVDGGFQADACAEEILKQSSVGGDDPRIVERSGRLLRDFLMAPMMRGVRGAGRRARHAARGGVAYLMVQVLALTVYSAIVLAALVLLRIRGMSVDEWLDRILFWR